MPTVEQEAMLEAALRAIDEANAEDPRIVVVRGVERPKALAEAELATEWTARLAPDAGLALLLAVRGHHLRRWRWPRDSYPEGRAGYLRWRRDLHERHAEELERILTAVGYDTSTVSRVQDLVRKRGLGSDPEVQVLEDALCLVFLELDFAELAARTERTRMATIVEKTLTKMSASARELATTIEGVPEGLASLAPM